MVEQPTNTRSQQSKKRKVDGPPKILGIEDLKSIKMTGEGLARQEQEIARQRRDLEEADQTDENKKDQRMMRIVSRPLPQYRKA
jgi:hypothetical protein